jgi:hypothetical protein
MNEEIKKSFKQVFVCEPSADFSRAVEKKILQVEALRKSEKQNNIVVYLVLFFIIGLPICVISIALISNIQPGNLEMLTPTNYNDGWVYSVIQIIQESTPTLLFIMVFFTLSKLTYMLQLKKPKIDLPY